MTEPPLGRLARVAPLAGIGYAVLTIAGDLVIGEFPDSGTSTAKLATFYASHHSQVAAGGMIFAWATLLLTAFGCALWARTRGAGAHPALAAAILVGTTLAAVSDLDGASAYWTLGHVSTHATVTPAALQAWHIAGSEGSLGGGIAILLLTAGLAGLATRAIPRSLAWTALPLGLIQLTPVGFLASMLFLLWTAAAGVVMAARPLQAQSGHAKAATRPAPGFIT
jgi:hypothetical protein